MKKDVFKYTGKIFLLVSFFLAVQNSLSQSFQGEIIYKIDYISRFPEVISNEKLNAMYGSMQKYYIKDGNYKSIFNGIDLKMQLYLQKENNLFFQFKSDTLYRIDAAVNKDTVIDVFMLEDYTVKIMDIECKVISIKTQSGTSYSYYYNHNYKVNVESFKNHLYGNWFYLISETQSLPLMMEIENKFFKSTFTAEKITPLKIKRSFFDLPRDVVVLSTTPD